MKTIIKSILNNYGYEINKVHKASDKCKPYTDLITKHNVVDLEAISAMSRTIPGMIEPRSGQFLYALCYMQEMHGDVVEVGSWLGRSSSFLARAVSESNNGIFYAIDHFQGNVGKEELYTKHVRQLDIKEKYLENLERLGLSNCVSLLDMPNDQAIKHIKSNTIRFIFIDGDHTKEGVQKDVELFLPKLVSGSIIVFDDFSSNFPGVIEVTQNVLDAIKISKTFSYNNTLVLML